MKFLFRLFVFFLILALVAIGILHLLYPPAKIQSMVEHEVGRKLHREITLDGIHPGLSGLGIERVTLSEQPNFSAGTFLVADDVKLRWSLHAFLHSLHWGSWVPGQWSGKFWIGKVTTPYYEAQHLTLTWDLTGVDAQLTHVNGTASLRQGAALIKNLNHLAANDKTLSVALMPMQLLQNIDRSGNLNLGLPDLSHWPVSGITGDYHFVNGVMTIDRFQVDSPELGMTATGDVTLATHKLALAVALHAPKKTMSGQMDLKANVTGTLEHPDVDLESLRKEAFKATVTGILSNPKAKKEIQKELQNIFK